MNNKHIWPDIRKMAGFAGVEIPYIKHPRTRLNPFTRSWLYNATAVRGALWWFRQSHSVTLTRVCHIQQQSHSVNYANQHSPGGGTTFAKRRHDVSNYIYPPPSPIVWWVSWKSVQPFLRTVVSYFWRMEKNKKNICKTYTHPPPTGRRLRK